MNVFNFFRSITGHALPVRFGIKNNFKIKQGSLEEISDCSFANSFFISTSRIFMSCFAVTRLDTLVEVVLSIIVHIHSLLCLRSIILQLFLSTSCRTDSVMLQYAFLLVQLRGRISLAKICIFHPWLLTL